jgi:hypothetical protein
MADAPIIQSLTQRLSAGKFLQLAGRGNSKVGMWRADKRYFVKIYPPDTSWPRRQAEKQAIDYYISHGITTIPHILYSDAELNYSVFDYIDGTPNYPIEANIFSQIESFLCKIAALLAPTDFPPAKEAFFHSRELKTHIDQRRAFLQMIDDPLLQSHLCHLDRVFISLNYATFPDFSCGSKTIISPSDFGTHNSLLTTDRRLFFIDFEYAGRDSLFKLLGDIYWHPGSNLTVSQRVALITPYLQSATDQATFRNVRLFMGLKWSLLLLNEFIPFNLQKRISALLGAADGQSIKQQQLEKSTKMLERLLDDWHGRASEFN